MIPWQSLYECKTSGVEVKVKRLLDRAYMVLRPEQSEPKRYPRSKLVLEYKFLKMLDCKVQPVAK